MEDSVKRILLVEDDRADACYLHEVLLEESTFKCTLDHCATVSATLDLLDEQQFDLIFLDLNLPDSQGFATFSRIRDVAPATPIIMLTGREDKHLIAKVLSEGAQDYIIKGQFDCDTLARATRYAIERNRLLVEIGKTRALEQYLAYHDTLTGLPSRLLFSERLEQALIYAKRYERLVAVLFLDLDGFKQINDTMGHGAGDDLLRFVAQRLRRNIRESDTVARFGGDEFIILLRDIKRMEDMGMVATKILRAVSTSYSVNGLQVELSGCLGISVFPGDGTDCETLIKRADYAMYRAKNSGKNRVKLFRAISENARQNLSLEHRMRQAIDEGSFLLHYQPQVSLSTGQIIGVETLIRWQIDDLLLLLPGDFIPLAEDTGLIVQLGDWVLREACRQYQKWLSSGIHAPSLAVNLSLHQFREIGLLRRIERVLDETGMDPQTLTFEITETCAMDNVDFTISTLKSLKNMGVKIALDDFGVGYSSLSHLKRLPIDLLKIDSSFVRDIPMSRDDISIVKAIIALARNLGIEVVAEGTETNEQADLLKSTGCDYIQGYFFSPPVSADSFGEMLAIDKRLPTTSPHYARVACAS